MKLDPKEYATRRRQLLNLMRPNSIAIIPSAPTTVRNRDVEHPFRQASDFYYLSGFAEEFSVIVLISGRSYTDCFITQFHIINNLSYQLMNYTM